jgi:O-antigen/teichoic acid export membrane protein
MTRSGSNELSSPPELLPTYSAVGAFVLWAACGLVQSIVVARFLGPAVLGVTAVAMGLYGTLAGFVLADFKEVGAREYYSPRAPEAFSREAYRSAIIRAGVGVAALQAMIACSLVLPIVYYALPMFTSSRIELRWLVAQGFALWALRTIDTLFFFVRLSRLHTAIAFSYVATSATSLSVFLLLFWRAPSLGGYFTSLAVSSMVALIVLSACVVAVFRREGIDVLKRASLPPALRVYASHWRFVLLRSSINYAKILHRQADVLVVAFFASDEVVGLYRFARSTAGRFSIVSTAVNSVFFPSFLEMLRSKSYDLYRRTVRRFQLAAIALVASAMGIALLLLDPLIVGVVGEAYLGAKYAIVLFLLPLLYLVGIHLWTWPVFVADGRIGRLTALHWVALAVQYAVTVVGLWALTPTPAIAAVGLLSNYPIRAIGTLALVREIRPEVIPWRGRRVRVANDDGVEAPRR